MTGYEAPHESAAILDLTGRGVLSLMGEDRARFLHAMSSNHIEQMKPGDGCYAFFLNAQGRILSDANVLCLDGRFLLDTEPASRETLFQHLDKFVIADDVHLEEATERYTVVGVEGPKAAEMLAALGASLPAKPGAHTSWNKTIVAALTFTGGPGFRIFAPPSERDAIMQELRRAGALDATAADADVVRLENCRPRYGVDFNNETLPQETRLMHALHFNKGCYLGQEIVERIRSRGRVNRQLAGLFISGKPPAPGVELLNSKTAAGHVTSAAFSTRLAKVVAIGMVRVEHAAPGTLLNIGLEGAEVRPIQPC